MKCDSSRPACAACLASKQECSYPKDSRRLLRPSKERMQSLEQNIANLWEQLRTTQANSSPSQLSPGALAGSICAEYCAGTDAGVEIHRNASPSTGQPEEAGLTILTPETMDTLQHEQLPPSSTEARSRRDLRGGIDSTEQHNWRLRGSTSEPSFPSTAHSESRRRSHGLPQPNSSIQYAAAPSTRRLREDTTSLLTGRSIQDPQDDQDEEEGEIDGAIDSSGGGITPREADIAGLNVSQNGDISVHGASSVLHPLQRVTSANTTRNYETSASAIRARLVSFATFSAQRETRLWRSPRDTLDLDGVDIEMAKHLLDLHWNRQHLAYLLTYRPAIMDSLSNQGPWANKLLLNAIYYSSSLYSDRVCLRSDPNDPQTAGLRFYDRFRALLADEMAKPSIPSAIALLLTSATLTSQVMWWKILIRVENY